MRTQFTSTTFHTIVLMIVDTYYKFLYADVGTTGAGSDGRVFAMTDLKDTLEDGSIGLPPAERLPAGDGPIPFYSVVDEAFPLKTWLMNPLPHRSMNREHRIFNYRLSRARRVVENVFGLLAARYINLTHLAIYLPLPNCNFMT